MLGPAETCVCQAPGKHISGVIHLPAIKFCNNIWALCMEDLDEVCKHGLLNTQLKFVHEIHNEEGEKVQPKLRKG